MIKAKEVGPVWLDKYLIIVAKQSREEHELLGIVPHPQRTSLRTKKNHSKTIENNLFHCMVTKNIRIKQNMFASLVL